MPMFTLALHRLRNVMSLTQRFQVGIFFYMNGNYNEYKKLKEYIYVRGYRFFFINKF